MKRLVSVLTLLPSVALAHSGDHKASGLLHILTGPDQLAMFAALVVVLGYLVYKRARS